MKGIILEGGGMRAGFAAGVLMALMDNGLTAFDSAIAVSASVPSLAYFAARQRQELEQVWRDELCTPKLVCYRNIPAAAIALSAKRPFLDIDYLVYRVFKEKYPLNLSALLNAKPACRFALTKLPEGKLVFKRPGDNDIYQIFKAALAVPGCYPSTVRIDGCEYLDGGTVNPLPVRDQLNEKIGKVLIILTKPLDCESEPISILKRSLFWRYFNRYDWMLEKLWEAAQIYNEQVSLLEGLADNENSRVFIVCPDKMPPAKFITRDREKINRTVDLGYKKVESAKHLIANFLRDEYPD